MSDIRKISPLIIMMMAMMVKTSFSQDVQSVSSDDLLKLLATNDGKTKVINFWATWCKPCVDELPFFVQATSQMKDQNFEFIFVSVDFQSVHNNVIEKAKQLGLKGTLLQMKNEGNEWIDKVDQSWSGAIPYTILIFPNGKRLTHYDQFENLDELKTFLNKNIPN